MKEYNVNYTVRVLGYEKTYTLPIKAENSTIAQKLVLEDELHNVSSEDILPQKNNKELYDAMYSGGEGKNDHAYSSRQVRLIVKFLDEP